MVRQLASAIAGHSNYIGSPIYRDRAIVAGIDIPLSQGARGRNVGRAAVKVTWRWMSNSVVMACVMLAALLVTWKNWPPRPWMEPAFEIVVGGDGRPRYTFTGTVNEAAPSATYGVDIKALIGGGIEEDVCRGGYEPSRPPNYAPDETPPSGKLLSWVVERYDANEYPGGCEAQLVPGVEHIIHIGWCRAAGVDCVSASARWVQPERPDIAVGE